MSQDADKTVHYTAQAGLIQRALGGDREAASSVLKYLSSQNQYLRSMMLETIHDLKDPSVWWHLLRCLALHAWDVGLDCDRLSDPDASDRVEATIREAFMIDVGKEDRVLKENLLQGGLDHFDARIRQEAAFLLGARGDGRAIPYLSELIQSDDPVLKLKAVQALGKIKDERSGPPLVQALVQGRSTVHMAAQHALQDLGPLARSAWLQVLEHPDGHIRWHAARGLGEIGDIGCVELLVEGLYDENTHVRWASSRVLIQLDQAALPSILNGLARRSLTGAAQEAVYHTLNAMTSHQAQEMVRPLLEALHGPAARVEAPSVAQRILLEMRK